MEKIKLLFVEDDSSFAFVTKGSLELTGLYDIRLASNGKEGLAAYSNFCPDVIVSDIEMPVLNGIEMIRKIRQKDEEIPILFATGRTHAYDVLEGYQLKADNFIKKPFLPEELDAHIQAIMKRVLRSEPEKMEKVIHLGSYSFAVETRSLYWEDEVYKLTHRESEVLQKLCRKKNRLVKRKELLCKLWGINDYYTSRSLDVFISKLRKYFAQDSSVLIETIRKEGWVFRCISSNNSESRK